jgi:hypothetical protein
MGTTGDTGATGPTGAGFLAVATTTGGPSEDPSILETAVSDRFFLEPTDPGTAYFRLTPWTPGQVVWITNMGSETANLLLQPIPEVTGNIVVNGVTLAEFGLASLNQVMLTYYTSGSNAYWIGISS